MDKILSPENAIQTADKLRDEGKSIVLAGGCFDILHIGHITYLEKAKEQADVLFVFLENDETIKKTKGPKRPINTQQDRSRILASLAIVDYVIMLPAFSTDEEYDKLVIQLKPAIIATTAGDQSRRHKERQANQIGATVVDVTPAVQDQSTTNIVTFLNEL